MLLTVFKKIPDHRGDQGKRYDLAHVVLFSVFAIANNAKSYRDIHSYIKINFKYLQKRFWIFEWKKAPAYTTIREILMKVKTEALEEAFREYAKELVALDKSKKYLFVNLDGKVVRGSFDHFVEQNALQIFSAFATDGNIILAHQEIPEEKKTNEIPIAQELIEKLGLQNCIMTLDAMHCQKKLSNQSKTAIMKR